MSQVYNVNILNQKFRLKTEHDERRVKKVVDYVNKKINELAKSSRTVSSLNVAILAALNITEELIDERELRAKEKQEVIDNLGQVLSVINV